MPTTSNRVAGTKETPRPSGNPHIRKARRKRYVNTRASGGGSSTQVSPEESARRESDYRRQTRQGQRAKPSMAARNEGRAVAPRAGRPSMQPRSESSSTQINRTERSGTQINRSEGRAVSPRSSTQINRTERSGTQVNRNEGRAVAPRASSPNTQHSSRVGTSGYSTAGSGGGNVQMTPESRPISNRNRNRRRNNVRKGVRYR